MDNGRTSEGEAARTDPALRGTKLHLFVPLRDIVHREALRRWPNLQLIRGVSVNVADVGKLQTFKIIPLGLRVQTHSVFD